MKKYLVIALVLATVTMFALPVFAQTPGEKAETLLGQVGTQAGIQTTRDLPGIIALIINVILTLLGVIFLVLMVYAGFLWMTAQGESKPVDQAKGIIKQAIIGLIITLAAYAISNFVITNIVKQI